ncbi:MAG: hypothetical protein LBF01_03635, partial [Bacteroidales bacterium]|nr:hypothetical protein [Bacteroidales bacterium]
MLFIILLFILKIEDTFVQAMNKSSQNGKQYFCALNSYTFLNLRVWRNIALYSHKRICARLFLTPPPPPTATLFSEYSIERFTLKSPIFLAKQQKQSQKPVIPRLTRNLLKISIDLQRWRGFRFASPAMTVAFGTSPSYKDLLVSL